MRLGLSLFMHVNNQGINIIDILLKCDRIKGSKKIVKISIHVALSLSYYIHNTILYYILHSLNGIRLLTHSQITISVPDLNVSLSNCITPVTNFFSRMDKLSSKRNGKKK